MIASLYKKLKDVESVTSLAEVYNSLHKLYSYEKHKKELEKQIHKCKLKPSHKKAIALCRAHRRLYRNFYMSWYRNVWDETSNAKDIARLMREGTDTLRSVKDHIKDSDLQSHVVSMTENSESRDSIVEALGQASKGKRERVAIATDHYHKIFNAREIPFSL